MITKLWVPVKVTIQCPPNPPSWYFVIIQVATGYVIKVTRIMAGIQRDKTMADKMMYILNDIQITPSVD